MNKTCYNESLCLHEYSKMIGFLNDSTFVRSRKAEMISTFQWNGHFRKASVNKTFTYVQGQKKRKKKAMSP